MTIRGASKALTVPHVAQLDNVALSPKTTQRCKLGDEI